MKFKLYYKEIRFRSIEVDAEDRQEAWDKGIELYRSHETGIEDNNYTLALMSFDDDDYEDIAEYEMGEGE